MDIRVRYFVYGAASAVAILACAWYAWSLGEYKKIRTAIYERSIISELKCKGADVYVSEDFVGWGEWSPRIVNVALTGDRIGDDSLSNLSGLNGIVEVRIVGTRITPGGIVRYLQKHRELRCLRVSETDFNQQQLQEIQGAGAECSIIVE